MRTRRILPLLFLLACTPSRDGRDDCEAACGARECGADPVCGDSCGTCRAPAACDEAAGTCTGTCVPSCGARQCGLEPTCGSSCGTCPPGQTCRADGTCASNTPPAGCTPACGTRVCGPDPACGASCGTCPPGQGCNAQGQCAPGTPTNQPPSVGAASFSPGALTPSQPVTMSVHLSDPDGLNDLVVAAIVGQRGTKLASLAPSLDAGVYTAQLTWRQLNDDAVITFTRSGTRSVTVRLIDGASHTVDKAVNVPLACDDAAWSACEGTCVDLQTSGANCGQCGRSVGETKVCVNGVPSCPSGWGLCDGLCRQYFSDEENCGSCHHVCPPPPSGPSGSTGTKAICRDPGSGTYQCITGITYSTRVVCNTACAQLGKTCFGSDAWYGPDSLGNILDNACNTLPPTQFEGYSMTGMYCFCR